jgi:hypothetical protein
MQITIDPKTIPIRFYPDLTMTLLHISVSPFPRQVFRLWLPEGSGADGVALYNQAKEGPQTWTAEDGGSTWRCRAFDTESAVLTSWARIRDDHLELGYELHNKSDVIWERVGLGTCYQMAAAEDFRDPEGERTYAWADGRLANIAKDGIPPECHEHHHPTLRYGMSMPDNDPGPAVIAVEARNGGSTAIAWESHSEYSGNSDPGVNCIHGGPEARDVRPGQTVNLFGWLGWSSGPVAALCERALAAVSDSKGR